MRVDGRDQHVNQIAGLNELIVLFERMWFDGGHKLEAKSPSAQASGQAVKRKRTRVKKGQSAPKQAPPAAIYLKRVGKVVVTYKQALEKLPEDKHIHPRRPMRLIPDKEATGKETNQNQSPGPQVNQSDFMSEKERKKRD